MTRKPWATPRKGDHIFVQHWLYSHHAIFLNKQEVVHFADGIVCKVTMDEFADGKTVQFYDYGNYGDTDLLNARVIAQRAESLIGHRGYDLNDHNCEHFANWCATNKSESDQVGNAWGTIASLAGIPLAIVAPFNAPVSIAIGTMSGLKAKRAVASFAAKGTRRFR